MSSPSDPPDPPDSSSSKSGTLEIGIYDSTSLPQQKSSIPESIPSTAVPSYAQWFKASLRNLRKISSPISIEDGVPVVQAPPSVMLKASDQWKGHIVAQFHGLIPPPAKIYSDLNPAWGKHGNIIIRTLSESSCLIMIPCVSTREWVLQIGYWQAGNVAFSVYPWSPEASLEMQELTSAPTWAVLKNVPPQMYSLDGISVISSAIGEPLHTEKSRLDPYNLGNTKVKVEIMLDNSPPTTIIVRDTQGNSVKVNVEYPRLPPKCCNCGRFGHLLNRCPKPLMKKKFGVPQNGVLIPGGTVVADTKISLVDNLKVVDTKESAPLTTGSQDQVEVTSITVASKQTVRRAAQKKRAKERAKSVPPVKDLIKHQFEALISGNSKQLVKEWIKESEDKKKVFESKFAEVGSSKSEKEVNSIITPAMISAKKFQKLASKKGPPSQLKVDNIGLAESGGGIIYNPTHVSGRSHTNRGRSSDSNASL